MNSKVKIIATMGPAMRTKNIIKEMIDHIDVVRLNFSWGNHVEHANYIKNIRESAQEASKKILIIQDLSGPRIQEMTGHKFNIEAIEIITSKDLVDLKFGIKQGVDYVAMSYVGDKNDVITLQKKMREFGKTIPIIAKIERKIAVDNIDEIIAVSDAIMIARGDLGNEIPLEIIPFVQKEIIQKCTLAGKPVIVATQMMLSMTESPSPTRAEVTDIVYAISNGADAVMLSEESAAGKYPLQSVTMMKKVILESEKYITGIRINSLS